MYNNAPTSIFLSFQTSEFDRMNNMPIYGFDKTLEEISNEEPIKAIKIISNELNYGKKIKPAIEIVNKLGAISSDLDGEQAAKGILFKTIENSIKDDIVIDPLDIVLASFVKLGDFRKDDFKLFSVPQFIISLRENY